MDKKQHEASCKQFAKGIEHLESAMLSFGWVESDDAIETKLLKGIVQQLMNVRYEASKLEANFTVSTKVDVDELIKQHFTL